LSESELSHQALSDVVPLRDVFSLVFFVSVGMLLDPGPLVANGGVVAALVAAVILGKALVCGWIARAFGYVNMAPWLVGLGLAQIGEFGFVLARAGLSGGYLSSETYDLALASTVLSMTISPVVFRAAIPLGRAWLRRHPSRRPVPSHAPVPDDLQGHVVVGGYGRTGRAVVAALRAIGVPVVVVELNHQAASAAAADGADIVLGDLGSETILTAARVAKATALVVALPDWPKVRLGIERARTLNQ
jgi:CPA2 family monovalent cation:H+ antiporter-2